jgi:hypothetical protein
LDGHRCATRRCFLACNSHDTFSRELGLSELEHTYRVCLTLQCACEDLREAAHNFPDVNDSAEAGRQYPVSRRHCDLANDQFNDLKLLVEVHGNQFQTDFKELEKSVKGLINYAKPLRRLQPVARKCRNTTIISTLQVQVLPSLPLRSDALYRFRNGKVAVESPKSHHLIRLAAF